MSIRVSSRINVDPFTDQQGYFSNALNAVDRVHVDGELPLIRGVAWHWKEAHRKARITIGTRKEIWLNLSGDCHELSIVHEIGHALDFWAFGEDYSAAFFASAFEEWRVAVEATDAYKRWQCIADIPGYRVYVPAIRALHTCDPVDKEHAEYLIEWGEIWARSYAQYIANRPRNPSLRNQLMALQRSSYNELYMAQWLDDEFVGVEKEVEALIRSKGWSIP